MESASGVKHHGPRNLCQKSHVFTAHQTCSGPPTLPGQRKQLGHQALPAVLRPQVPQDTEPTSHRLWSPCGN